MDNAGSRAREILGKNHIMTIATADADGRPWVSPVFFSYDKAYNLYWVSYKNSRHSQNVRCRPKVDIVILNSGPNGPDDGVYFEARAFELSDKGDIKNAIATHNKRQQDQKFIVKSPADVGGDKPWRIYKAAPVKISKRDDISMDGYSVTIRKAIGLLK